MTHITIKDIATRLGISVSTVSRALNDHPDINEETKKSVYDVANKLHYSPNIFAKSLKTKRNHQIGVIVPDIRYAFFSSAISGIEEVAYNSGYTISVAQSNEEMQREIMNTNAFISNRVSGLIISISQTTTCPDHFNNLREKDIPFVFFDRALGAINAHKVTIDDFQSAYNAVNYLIKKGYKNIAHFAGPLKLEVYQKRKQGYLQALVDNGLEVKEDLIIEGPLHEEFGYEGVSSFNEKGIMPDAIFSVSDNVAIGAFQKIKEIGKKIPEDIALVGFSNNPVTSLIDPPLTTVEQYANKMGKIAAQMLLDIIEGRIDSNLPESHILETQIIERRSA